MATGQRNLMQGNDPTVSKQRVCHGDNWQNMIALLVAVKDRKPPAAHCDWERTTGT